MMGLSGGPHGYSKKRTSVSLQFEALDFTLKQQLEQETRANK